MSPEPSGIQAHTTLAWVGLGVGVISIAFTLRPTTHASTAVFWSVLTVGIAALLIGATIIAVDQIRSRRGKRKERRQRRLVAAACERYADAMSAFVTEQWRARPRSLPFNGDTRLQRWQEKVEARYRKNFRSWGLETFDEAAGLGAIAVSLRASVEAPDIDQLRQLPDLFRDAARSLERGTHAREGG